MAEGCQPSPWNLIRLNPLIARLAHFPVHYGRECASLGTSASLGSDQQRRQMNLPEVRPPEGWTVLFIFGKKGTEQQLFADRGHQLAPAQVIHTERDEELVPIVLVVELS